MSKVHVYELDYMRAVAMLGVLGIHTGAFAIENPQVNVHFFGLVDIITRFSVPIFFFISAFGLFLGQDLKKNFDYLEFLKRRIHVVLYPYLAWTALYMAHQYWLYQDITIFTPLPLFKHLFFGLGSYHLYFMILMLWFYLLMPLWRALTRLMLSAPLTSLLLLFSGQILFNLYSTTILQTNSENYWLNLFIEYRLNYWPFHYLFIFQLGAVCAMLYPQFTAWLDTQRYRIYALGLIGTLLLMIYYYYLIYTLAFTCEAAVSTLHQLHPLGIFYTLTTTLFLFAFFRHIVPLYQNHMTLKALSLLGASSYLIYLVHPFVMYYLSVLIHDLALTITVPVNIAFYMATALFSLGFAKLLNIAKGYVPILHLLCGSSMAQPKKTLSSPPTIHT